jgi:hypothetical protein
MLTDGTLVFSEAQALTVTAVSTNVLDMGVAQPDQGQGVAKWVSAYVDAAFASGTSIAVVLQDSADNSTFAAILTGPVVATAALVAGAVMAAFALPMKHRRYLRLSYTVVGTFDAGAVNAVLGPPPRDN